MCRVLIVDDSRFMRRLFSDLVNADEAFTVAATASDGEEAVALALQLRPDIITMDLEMPRMNGLEALHRIMSALPTPVIMLSAVTDNGTRDTIKALQYGAIDFIRKPDGAAHLDIGQVGGLLMEKLRIAAEMVGSRAFGKRAEKPVAEPEMPDVLPAPAAVPATAELAEQKPPAPAIGPVERESKPGPGVKKAADARQPAMPAGGAKFPRSASFTQIVAVGTSTGGPRALHEVLTRLPGDFEAPVLVVQHMPPKFTHSLALRLDSFCAIRVCEATQNEIVQTGTAYIAPGGKQMSLSKAAGGGYRIKLSEEGPRSGHMPSVDVLFESLIGHRGLKRHAVLMTGMGSDGAKGMKALQEDGAETRIAEAEDTCVVYGMPRSAVELGAVSHVLPLPQIASVLVREVKSRK